MCLCCFAADFEGHTELQDVCHEGYEVAFSQPTQSVTSTASTRNQETFA